MKLYNILYIQVNISCYDTIDYTNILIFILIFYLISKPTSTT